MRFSKMTTFLGRNGVFNSIGLRMSKMYNAHKDGTKTQVLVMEPITSKETTGRCSLEVQVQDLPQLIWELWKHLPEYQQDLVRQRFSVYTDSLKTLKFE